MPGRFGLCRAATRDCTTATEGYFLYAAVTTRHMQVTPFPHD